MSDHNADYRWVRHPEEVRLAYICNYYDGPLSGMAVFGGDDVWFQNINPVEHEQRLYGLWRLTDEQLREERRRNQGFCERVGGHWIVGYDQFGRRSRPHSGSLRPNWMEWYDDPDRGEPPKVDGEPFAIFMLSSCHGRRQRSARYWMRRIAHNGRTVR